MFELAVAIGIEEGADRGEIASDADAGFALGLAEIGFTGIAFISALTADVFAVTLGVESVAANAALGAAVRLAPEKEPET
jgi:hypothetical protein